MARFPRIKITGGPAGRTLTVTSDGESIPGIRRFELTADVNEAVVLRSYQIAEVDVDVSGLIEDAGFVARVGIVEKLGEEPDGTPIRTTRWIAEGQGRVLRDALLDAAENLPAEPPANIRTISLKPQ